jgi:hypothetical protein
MLESANDARKRATLAAGALRIVNDSAAAPLIAAVQRGETSVFVEIEPAELPASVGSVGRVRDEALVELLSNTNQIALARACRIFVALGFSLSAAPEVYIDEDDCHRVGDAVQGVWLTGLELGFAAASASVQQTADNAVLLHGVVLPAAHLWRHRAESARLLVQFERKALATVSQSAERGSDTCKLTWRELAPGVIDHVLMHQLGEALRQRGFRVDPLDGGATLRLKW